VAVASGALVLLAIVLALHTVLIAFWTHHVLPLQEEWLNLIVFKSWLGGGHPIADLFSQHSEHRLVFPRIILFSDFLLFRGTGYFGLAVIFFILALLVGLFLFLLIRLGPNAPGAVGIGAMIPLLLFSLVQWENFRAPIQVFVVGAFAASCFAVTLFSLAIERARGRGRWAGPMAASFALTAVATFSAASGLLSSIILIV